MATARVAAAAARLLADPGLLQDEHDLGVDLDAVDVLLRGVDPIDEERNPDAGLGRDTVERTPEDVALLRRVERPTPLVHQPVELRVVELALVPDGAAAVQELEDLLRVP